MPQVFPIFSIPADEISFDYIHSSGPGGQNINKVASAVQLRFDVRSSPSLPEDVKTRLARLAGRKLTSAGILVIQARRHRSQERNREDALQRFELMLRRASEPPQKRHPTHPGAAARQERLETKKQRGSIKKQRQSIRQDED
jgi:ribosome-associated protein